MTLLWMSQWCQWLRCESRKSRVRVPLITCTSQIYRKCKTFSTNKWCSVEKGGFFLFFFIGLVVNGAHSGRANVVWHSIVTGWPFCVSGSVCLIFPILVYWFSITVGGGGFSSRSWMVSYDKRTFYGWRYTVQLDYSDLTDFIFGGTVVQKKLLEDSFKNCNWRDSLRRFW
jgi:hypothetical protein